MIKYLLVATIFISVGILIGMRLGKVRIITVTKVEEKRVWNIDEIADSYRRGYVSCLKQEGKVGLAEFIETGEIK